ncbi:MAG: hypothetical protein IPK52_00365 [Chloroflexi bacterium]|nr:hypothetical protein [Chloroflexota bacterium]
MLTYSRASDGYLRDAQGWLVNTLFIRHNKLRSIGYMGKVRPMFFYYFVHKTWRINRLTYRAGYTRRGLPK